MKRLTRRQFLQLSGGSAGALFLTACGGGMMNGGMMGSGSDSAELLTPAPTSTLTSHTPQPFSGDVDLDFTLRTTVSQQLLRPGNATSVLRYVGELNQGTDAALTDGPSYLGPTIRVRRGQRVRIRLVNELQAETITHWHGLHLPDEMDGHPRYAIPSGEEYIYEFTVNNRAGTYWYHPHPHGMTGAQVYYGLAGFFIVDEEKQSYGLPHAEFDVPLVIQDRTFAADNQLTYVSDMHQVMQGFWADTILVNGQLDYRHEVATRPYRLRLLNGSNARVYKLAWDDESPITVIGSDGGLLARPVEKPYVLLSPGERVEVWRDFGRNQLNDQPKLVALPLSGANNSTFDIMTFDVTRAEQVDQPLPTAFAPLDWLDPATAVNADNPRTFDFFVNHMTPTIDGRQFEMNEVADDEIVKLNTTELWRVTNVGNGANGFPHPVHIHGNQFQVLERSGTPTEVAQGYVDEGWKDTVLLMPDETATLLMRFSDHAGMFVYHCHNLEHEDGGMMRNYRIDA